jgi:hypothetical protein
MKTLIGLFKFIEGLFLFALAIYAIKWFIKGHFSKYFIFFWAYSIYFTQAYYQHNYGPPSTDSRPDYVIWEDNIRGFFANN